MRGAVGFYVCLIGLTGMGTEPATGAEAPIDLGLSRRDELDQSNALAVAITEQTAVADAPLAGPTDDWFNAFHPLTEMESLIASIATAHAEIAEFVVYGNSVEGRSIVGLRISGPGDPAEKPTVVCVGMQHAAEWISGAMVAYLGWRLTDAYETDADVRTLVDRNTFHIIPIVNADGYVFTWSTERLWRKNRRLNADGSRGVDLDRNWSYAWGGAGSDDDPAGDEYRGAAAFSEPETRAIRDLVQAASNPTLLIDFHAPRQYVLHPWSTDCDPPADVERMQGRVQRASEKIGGTSGVYYEPNQSCTVFAPRSGTLLDWAYEIAGMDSFQFYLRDDGEYGNQLPDDQILPTLQENWPAWVSLVDETTAPLIITAPHGLPRFVSPADPPAFTVQVQDGLEQLDATTVALHHRATAQAPFVTESLTQTETDTYTGVLPPFDCADVPAFFLSATTTTDRVVTFPAAAPEALFEPLVTDFFFEDDFEADNAWTIGDPNDTATTGIWERADPNRTDAQPEYDHSPHPRAICFLTGQSPPGAGIGEVDVDGGSTTLISPRLRLQGLDTLAGYWRWFSNDAGAGPNEDVFRVEVSRDAGQSWTPVETVGPTGDENSGGWFFHPFRVGDFVTSSNNVHIRFIAEDIGNPSIIEAAIDDFHVYAEDCVLLPGDADADGDVDMQDFARWPECGTTPDAFRQAGCGALDFDLDGDVDLADGLAMQRLLGG